MAGSSLGEPGHDSRHFKRMIDRSRLTHYPSAACLTFPHHKWQIRSSPGAHHMAPGHSNRIENAFAEAAPEAGSWRCAFNAANAVNVTASPFPLDAFRIPGALIAGRWAWPARFGIVDCARRRVQVNSRNGLLPRQSDIRTPSCGENFGVRN